MRSPLIAATLSVLALLTGVSGCSPREQSYDQAEVVPASKTKQLRSWLEGVAERGELDSGVETLDEDVAALASESVENLDAIKAVAAELKSATSATAVREHASAMLELLPESNK